jgi:hypothetical protein
MTSATLPQGKPPPTDRLADALAHELGKYAEGEMWLKNIIKDERLDPWAGATLLLRLSRINGKVEALIRYGHTAVGETSAEEGYLWKEATRNGRSLSGRVFLDFNGHRSVKKEESRPWQVVESDIVTRH